tara:strand:- start:422 stop:628 length:207 start_codon:yes stop_codon:yes gene_type:complete
MATIRVYNSARMNERGFLSQFLDTDDVTIHKTDLTVEGKPYIMFEHENYPLGSLMAIYDGTFWQCDLD